MDASIIIKYKVTCCGKLFDNEYDAQCHITDCRNNPGNKCCETCARLYNDSNIDSDYHDPRSCTKHGLIKDMCKYPSNCKDWRNND